MERNCIDIITIPSPAICHNMKKTIALFFCLTTLQHLHAQLTTAANGLTAASTNVNLGGTLSQNTSIDVGSSYNFDFKKSSNSYLSILNNGNVGIGMASPGYKLHLPASSVLSIGEANNTWVGGGVNLSMSQLKFRYDDAGGSWSVGIRPNGYSIETFDGNSGSITGSSIKTGSVVAESLVSYNNYTVAKIYDGLMVIGGGAYSGFPLSVKANTAATPGYYAVMSVDHSIAFDPTAVGGNRFNIHLAPQVSAPSNHATGITFGATDSHENEGQAGIYVQSGSSYGTKMFFGTTDLFTAGSKVRMVLDHLGNLGIGTNTPQAKLDVNGNIFSNGKIVIGTTDAGQYGNYAFAVNGTGILNKIKVKAYGSWPDYVFEENYDLPSLQFIEKFVKQYKHLPGVPSAKEIEKENIDLGNMQVVLLKKIEELTLYNIELEKKTKIQDEKIASISKDLQVIKALLKNNPTTKINSNAKRDN